MFESILFRQQNRFDSLNPLDLNAFFEALLFYQSVLLVADKSIMQQLFRQCGYEFVTALVENGFLKIQYLNNIPAIYTANSGSALEIHNAVHINSPVLDFDNVIRDLFRNATGKSGLGRRLAARFEKNVNVIEHDQNLIDEVIFDYSDTTYVENSVKEILKYYTPEYPNIDTLNFKVEKNMEGLHIETNIDFGSLNKIYNSKISEKHSTMSGAYLLSHIFNVRSDIYFSAFFESEIATNGLNSNIMKFKYLDTLERRNISDMTIKGFQDFVLNETVNIYGLIQNGEKTPMEFLKLLEGANKFKDWLKDKDVESNLIKEYYQASISENWIDKMPGKPIRWSIFSGLGIAADLSGAAGLGTILGVGINATDTFLFDKLFKGWKPNHFVTELNNFSTGDTGKSVA